MSDHVSNWKDAENVEMPPCTKCGAVNIPGRSPTIEIVNQEYVCAQCGHGWPRT